MDKRTIMAIVLSMAVVLIWQLIFAPPRKAPAPVPIDEEVQKALPEQKGKAP